MSIGTSMRSPRSARRSLDDPSRQSMHVSTERAVKRRRADAELDDADKAIVELLQTDGRMPYTRMGELVGLSEAATRQRVQRLVDERVVQIVGVTDPLRLGFRRQDRKSVV